MQTKGAHKLITTYYCFYGNDTSSTIQAKSCVFMNTEKEKKDLNKQLDLKAKFVLDKVIRSGHVPHGYDRAHW